MDKLIFGLAVFCLACVQPMVSAPLAPYTAPAAERVNATGTIPRAKPEPIVVPPGGYRLSTLPVFAKVLYFVRANYYDKRRLDWRRLLLGALEAVGREVPEIVIEPLPEVAPDSVAVTVSGERRAFRIDDVDAPWRLRSMLQTIMDFAQPRLRPVPEAMEGRRLLALEMAAANGMLSRLDPHSVLLDPNGYAEIRTSASTPPGSTGIVLVLDDQRHFRISMTSPGSPAARGGLKAGDRLILVDGEPSAGLTSNEVVARLRGPIGSGVDLEVEREGTRHTQKVHLERERVVASSVDGGPRILTAPAGPGAPPARIGYFHLAHLAREATAQVQQALRELAQQGVGGVVVDLRGNHGGLYEQAAHVADLFVKKGTLVSMVGAGEGQRRDELALDDGAEPAVPLAVLVDHQTASGAEIVAAALRDLGGAVVLGEQTVGMGTIQVVFDVESPLAPAGAAPTAADKLGLKLTTAQFLTAAGASIQLAGLVPDVELRAVTAQRDGERRVFRMEPLPWVRREAQHESPLDATRPAPAPAVDAATIKLYHLEPGSPSPAWRPGSSVSDPAEDEPSVEERPAFSGDDFAASFAAELLAKARGPGRASTLAAAKAVAGEVAAREDARIAAATAALGADWRPGPRSPGSHVTLAIEPGKGTVHAGEVARLRGQVTNAGTAPTFRLRALLRSDDPAFDGAEMPFGRLGPGETRTFELLAPIGPNALTRVDVVEARLLDGDGPLPNTGAETMVAVEERPRPALSFACRAKVDPATRAAGGGRRTAAVKLAVLLHNEGTIAAEQAEATVHVAGVNPNQDGVRVRVGRWSGVLAPGAKREVAFVVDVPARAGLGPLDLTLALDDPALFEPIRAALHIVPGSTGLATADEPWHVTPAQVTARPARLTVDAPPLVASDTVHVTGEVQDDTAAGDVSVYVWNRSLDTSPRKVFYRSASTGAPRLPFAVDVPLWRGSNLIVVQARDSDGNQTSRGLLVLRRAAPRPAVR